MLVKLFHRANAFLTFQASDNILLVIRYLDCELHMFQMVVAPLVSLYADTPHLALHSIQFCPEFVKAGRGIFQLDIG